MREIGLDEYSMNERKSIIRIQEPYHTIYHFILLAPADHEELRRIIRAQYSLQFSYKAFVVVDFPKNNEGLTFLAVFHANPFDSTSIYGYVLGKKHDDTSEAYIWQGDEMNEEHFFMLFHDFSIGNPDEWHQLELTNEPGEPIMRFSVASNVRFDPTTMRPALPSDEFENLKPCIAFDMEDAREAYHHMSFITVEDYGGRIYGHDVHVLKSGSRSLLCCENCGGYALGQYSEYWNPVSKERKDYVDYFPVSGPEEADELNRKYDGSAIEKEFPKRYLKRINGKLSWSVMNEHIEESEE